MKLPKVQIYVKVDKHNPESISFDCGVCRGVPVELGNFILHKVRKELERSIGDPWVATSKIPIDLEKELQARIEHYVEQVLMRLVVDNYLYFDFSILMPTYG